MHYYLYEIKNTVNDKIYIGVHKTKSLDDGYMGSGKDVSNAIRKYGIEHFTKTILETFDSSEAMFAREKEVVTDEFLLREDTYNLRRGGFGGFEYINKTMKTEQRQEISSLGGNARKIVPTSARSNWGKSGNATGNSDYQKDQYINGRINGFRNKSHSCESKMAISAANQISASGEKNSQYGTMWITNGLENKKIMKDLPIPSGWGKGRITIGG